MTRNIKDDTISIAGTSLLASIPFGLIWYGLGGTFLRGAAFGCGFSFIVLFLAAAILIWSD